MKLIILALLCLFLTGCTKVYTDDYKNPANPLAPVPIPKEPTPTVPVVKKDLVEFRVNGNASSATIRYNNSLDGLTQLTTTLPYVILFESTRDNMFLLLEATPGIYSTNVQVPFLSLQIYVNGNLFREASSSTFLANTISVSGTFRR